jgi:hypothetical protein
MTTLLRSWTPTAPTSGGGSVGPPFTDPDACYLVRAVGPNLGIDRVSGGAGVSKSPLLLPDASPTGVVIAALVPAGQVGEFVLKFTQSGGVTTRKALAASVSTGGLFSLVWYLDEAVSYLQGVGSSSLGFPARNKMTWVVAALRQVDATHVSVYSDIRDVDNPDTILLDGSSNASKLAITTTDGPSGSAIVGQSGLTVYFTSSAGVREVRLWSYDGTITPGSGFACGATELPSLANLLVPGRLAVLDGDPTTVRLGIDLGGDDDQSSGGAPPLSYQMQSSPVSAKGPQAPGAYADIPGVTGHTPSVPVTAAGLFVRAKISDSAASMQTAYSEEVYVAPIPVPRVRGMVNLGDSYSANGAPPWPTTARRLIRNRQRLAACAVVNRAMPFTRVEDWVPGHPGPLHPEFTWSYFDAAIVAAIRSGEAGQPVDVATLLWGINDANTAVTPQMYRDNYLFLLEGYDPAVDGIPAWWQNRATSTLALAPADSATGYGPFNAGDARPGLLSMGWLNRICLIKPPYCQIVSVNANDIRAYATMIDEIVAMYPDRLLALDADAYQVVGGNTQWWSATDHLTQDGWDAMGERIAQDLLGQIAGGNAGGDTVTEEDKQDIIDGVMDAEVEPGVSLRTCLAAVGAVVAGTGPGTMPGAKTYNAMGLSGTGTPRVVATVGGGTRTSILIIPPA